MGAPRVETGLPDYAQSSACAPGSMETRTQALRKPVIPAKAGIQFNQRSLDSRFRGNDEDGGGMTGNDGLKETTCLSSVRDQASLPNERTMEVRT